MILVLAVACGEDKTDPAGTVPTVDVAGTLSNGSSLADIQTHWTSDGTSGPLLLISFLTDGTGQLNFSNDDLYSIYSRQLHDFTWSASGNTITVNIANVEKEALIFTLTDVSGSSQEGSMFALLEDENGTLFTLSLTLQTGPPSCC